MNDNQTNVIDLMALEQDLSAVIVPNDIRDAIILGFGEAGNFYFLSGSEDMGQLSMLITLAQRRVAELYDKILEPDDEPPCAA